MRRGRPESTALAGSPSVVAHDLPAGATIVLRTGASMFRWLTLTLGPVAIIGGLYWLMRPEFGADLIAAQAQTAPREDGSPKARRAAARALEDACLRKGTELARKLGSDCRVIVHAPFVIA